MLALLLPAGLLALAALALPALIHLARRSEERLTDFAALRWLSEKPKPRQRLRFDEWPLLLIRLLLLALVALWLARPALRDEADATPWIVAAPGVDVASVPAEGAEVRWLAPGFPSIDEVPPAAASVASLLRQLDTELPPGAPLTVLVPERLSGLDAERLKLSRKIDWQIRPGAMPVAQPATLAAPVLAVRYAPSHAGGLRYLRAAASAWQRPDTTLGYGAAPLEVPLPAKRETLVWLAAGPLPAKVVEWVERGGTALVSADTVVPAGLTAQGDMATERSLGRGRLLQLVQPLTPAALPILLEPSFPRHLHDLLAPPAEAPSIARAADVAPLTGGTGYPQPARDLQPWLALLIAVVLLGERWMATRRVRRPAP